MAEGYRFLAVPCTDAHEYVVDKEKSCEEFATYFLARVMKMFRYDGLPEEIPVDCMSKMYFERGFLWFTKWKGYNNRNEMEDKYYVFQGNMGEITDAYYRPTGIIISNPGANCYKTFYLNRQKGGTYYGDEGVLLRNDTLYHGLMPLIKRYAYLLAENVLTMHSADVFLRIIALISASDDDTLASANNFIRGIENGKMSAVGENSFFEGVRMQSPPSNNGSYLTQFIEYQQYFLGSFFNEIGLNANFNMKRESIAKSESSLNEDSMLPLCQNMLRCRQEDFDVVNEMYGLNIKVSFDSAWLQNALEIMFNLESMKSGGMAKGNGSDSKAIQIDENGKEDSGSDEAAEEKSGQETMAGNGAESGDATGDGTESGSKDEESSGEGSDSEESGSEGEENSSETAGEVENDEAAGEVEKLILEASGLDGSELEESIQIDESDEESSGKDGESDDREKETDSEG